MILAPNKYWHKIFFLSGPRYCDWGLIVVIAYYFQIWNKKEHIIMGPMYIETLYSRPDLFSLFFGRKALNSNQVVRRLKIDQVSHSAYGRSGKFIYFKHIRWFLVNTGLCKCSIFHKNTRLFVVKLLAVTWVPCILEHLVYIYIYILGFAEHPTLTSASDG